jgi:hypothetical protein
MDDAGALRVLPAFGLETEQAVHERPGRVPGSRMDDQPGRLVDDEQVLVLPRDPQLHLLRHELGGPALGRVQLELLAAGEAEALRACRAVDEHAALREQALRLGP